MYKSSLIPSESQSFPDHFRQVVAEYRNSTQKPRAEVIPPREVQKQRFSRLIGKLLAIRPKNGYRLPAAPPALDMESASPSPQPSAIDEANVATSIAPSDTAKQVNPRLEDTKPAIPNGTNSVAPVPAPAESPLRKSLVPSGLKRKIRWNRRAEPAQPAVPMTNGAAKVEPDKAAEQKTNSKTPRRPKPLPRFVLSPPPSLVQALLSYDAKTSPHPSDSTTDIQTDTP
jgi:hypothetical protein